ncbi:sigma-54-dependent transcriptional regulator [Enterococcus phoeniculicola]|uniref:Transcriptional antiterminator bglG:Sigma-54 factor n=1 Tax=Enterococcus phoeniculicola ATCC BAA-412 TaxID=1158610 RepID=R3U660_9ENTE|nr:sigma-54-dependent transcriptional regulator [Enterococcus phoeniculicola]EOL48908.1 transcriptional antiterminator bglG:Sigma-54 factor [Enterococcus phoeniculicola ATCC BAA-412]EOT72754.1 transcriptional antiterminator bglG:Sigma-54 factor [Enterococcus phoeniculicola ATCC BAA-412]
MSKRIDRIYAYVKEQTSQLSEEEVRKGAGVTTSEVAEAFSIQRTNSSKDLNQLVKDGRLTKLDGRPVRYVLAKNWQELPTKKYVPSYMETPVEKKKKPVSQPVMASKDIFSRIIGASGSMKNSIEQAKAAVLYPPKGLNCLITGPTGSGKTYFAHAIFQYAKLNKVIEPDKELIVFNCADYANNPELLMSHLFGYVKGAFTGAESDKNGIIDEADGGILFLDEIHRLPPEGQEMIFYFMDHGTYSRLGETSKTHQAAVRIIGATTEDPSSTLLDTFVRRIPINIQLPPFAKRPASEKVDLVKVMVSQEANRIERRISLTEDVVKALIGSVTYGNIGQLKSNIQLVCARGFLNHMQQEEISITINDLPEGIRAGVIQLASDREASTELAKVLEPKIDVSPNGSILEIQSDSYELPYNLYDIIGDKATLLKSDGLDQEAINHFISTDINIHLKSFYKDHGFSFNAENKLSEFVDQTIIDVTNQIYHRVKKALDYEFQQNFVYAMSLHISSFLKKIYLGEERHTNDNIKEMAVDFPKEFEVAKQIRHFISEQFQVEIPESEDYYLTVLLVSLRDEESVGRVGVIVAAHGSSTASSMVQVVKQLLDVEKIIAVDMPLDMHPRTALERIEHAALQIDEGSGVMLLVDMGSLATFSEKIQRDTGVPVRTIDMVTTSLVLETVRKASVMGADLDNLYESLKNFRGYAADVTVGKTEKRLGSNQVILAICASGEGTAQKIKEIIDTSLEKRKNNAIQVVTLSVLDVKEKMSMMQEKFDILATTGIIDPKIQAPFIPLERFIDHDVDHILDQLLLEDELEEITDVSIDEEQARTICVNYMEESFTFINPTKLIDPLWQFAMVITEKFSIDTARYAFQINLTMHLAGMVERILLGELLSVESESLQEMKRNPAYLIVEAAARELESKVHLSIPPAEEYYLMQSITNQQMKKIQ